MMPGRDLLFPYHDHLDPGRDHGRRDLHPDHRGVRRRAALAL